MFKLNLLLEQDMNKLPIEKRAQIIGLLVEGNSLRSTTRLADCSINTVTKLLVDVGAACSEYQDKTLRNLPCKRVQCDEIWSFVYAKERNVTEDMKEAGQAGDVWTWTALCADTKLIACWMIGDRTVSTATQFMQDLAGRLASRVQLTTDGYRPYLNAVDSAFAGEIDYGQLAKVYASGPTQKGGYTATHFIRATKRKVRGAPDADHISTSFVERQNLTMRMGMRRFTRSTNAFSKKVENHAHAIALHFMHYNFGRVHKTLRVTPAMQAGIADHVWTLEEIANLAAIEAPKTRGPYKKSLGPV